MPRQPRQDYPGAWHHVMHRGSRSEPIFVDDEDCVRFFDVLAEAVAKRGLEVHAYSLMPNHYHLLVRTASGCLSRAMQHVNGVFTRRTNDRHGWDGPLFRGRFHNRVVEDDLYLKQVLAYIHLNPVKAHLVPRPEAECWTSHRAYLGAEGRPPWLTCDVMLEAFGGAERLEDYVRALHVGRERWTEFISEDRGWHERAEATPERPLLAQVAPVARRLEVDEAIARVCEITGASLDDLRTASRGRGANPARRFAAWALRRSTDASASTIGEALEMSRRQVYNAATRTGSSPDAKIERWMQTWDESEK